MLRPHSPLSFIPYPLSLIPYPLSFIPYPLSLILYPLSLILYPLSLIPPSLALPSLSIPFLITRLKLHHVLAHRHVKAIEEVMTEQAKVHI